MNSRLVCAFVIFLAFSFPRIAHCQTQSPQTPLGAYQKSVNDEIGRIWYHHVLENKERISVGVVVLTFRITAKGQVENLKVLSNTANHKAADIAAQTIREAKFAPIPEGVLTPPHAWLDQEMAFNMYDTHKRVRQ